ncbi:MAG TPA: hypothetical protein VHU91_01595, partial [Mycobacteriales bacterium]|nr:hypothetical protein [Mycobacteriales bacterium]
MSSGHYGEQQPWQQQPPGGPPWGNQYPSQPPRPPQGQPGGQYPGGQGPYPGQFQGQHPGFPSQYPGPYPPATAPQRSRKGLIIGIVAAVVLVLGLGIGGVVLLGKDNKDSKSHSSKTDKTPNSPVALMKKIQAADPCAIHNIAALKKYGPNQGLALDRSFNDCSALSGDKNNQTSDVYKFELTLGTSYTAADKAKDTPETVGGLKVFKLNVSEDLTDSCYYNLPYPGLDYAVEIRAVKLPPEGGNKDWPQRCQVAKEYLQAVSSKALSLPARTKPPAEPTLEGKDPCAKSAEAAAAVSGWTAGQITYQNPYFCRIPLTKTGSPVPMTLSIYWDINAEQSTTSSFGGTAKAIQLGGLSGAQLSSDNFGSGGGSCSNAMVFKKANPDE